MKPKKCRKILNGIALAVIAVDLLSYLPAFREIRGAMIAGATLLLAGDVVFGFLFMRCPHCKKILNFRWSSQSICHNCGGRLDE